MHSYRLETPDIQTYVSDWEVAKTTLNIPHPCAADGAREWLRQQFESPELDKFYFAICLKDSSLIGAINVGITPRHHHAEIGYWIGRPLQGYASEAARRIVEFCFEELNLNRVFANYFAETRPPGG